MTTMNMVVAHNELKAAIRIDVTQTPYHLDVTIAGGSRTPLEYIVTFRGKDQLCMCGGGQGRPSAPGGSDSDETVWTALDGLVASLFVLGQLEERWCFYE
jgi:hypothetical protein